MEISKDRLLALGKEFAKEWLECSHCGLISDKEMLYWLTEVGWIGEENGQAHTGAH